MKTKSFCRLACSWLFAVLLVSTPMSFAAAKKLDLGPLVSAVASNDLVAVKLLLSNKADVNFLPENGMNSLMTAAYAGYVDMCKLLIAHGAVSVRDPNGFMMQDYLRSTTHRLPLATKLQILELLDNNTNKLTKASAAQSRKLAKERELQKLKEIIEHAGIDINKPDETGKTALMEAAADGDIETCQLLISKGADASIKDKKGKTAFDYACTSIKNPTPEMKEKVHNVLKTPKSSIRE